MSHWVSKHQEPLVYPCPVCNKKFTEHQNYLMHLRDTKHDINSLFEKWVFCPECSQPFSGNSMHRKLAKHQIIHERKDQYYQCPWCEKMGCESVFHRCNNLLSHIKDMHWWIYDQHEQKINDTVRYKSLELLKDLPEVLSYSTPVVTGWRCNWLKSGFFMVVLISHRTFFFTLCLLNWCKATGD